MFSNFTSNVTGFIGSIGQNKDEEVPTPPGSAGVVAEPAVEQPVPDAVGEVDPATGEPVGDAKAGVFSSVSSKMTGWLGNASIPSMPAMAMPSMPAMPAMPSIPGLRKGNAAEDGGIANEALATSPDKEQTAVAAEAGDKDEDDRSRYISATEGADSRPQSAAGTPTEENAGKMGNVTAAAGKVTAGAKSFGSFLYSAVNKAGSKIKETVKDNTILGEFNKEQEAFAQSQAGQGGEGVCPWVGHQNEDKIKEEILSLSADRRNFVRAPPAGGDFDFDYGVSYPVAQAIMVEDPALEKMRFELVPKIITEENFWRNYFYRVALICQAGDLGTLGDANEFGKNEVANTTQSSDKNDTISEKPNRPSDGSAKKLSESEFVSDAFQKTSETDLEEVKAGMRKLGIDSLAQQAIESSDGKNNEQWEKDLEAELQDYEVVNDGGDKTNWMKDVDELLDEDEDDLK